MDLVIGILACAFIYTLALIVICLLITQSWIFLIFIVINVIVFFVMGVLYVQKAVFVRVFGKTIAKYVNTQNVKKMLCKFVNFSSNFYP